MNDANFFGSAPDPASDPQGFQRQQALAAALMNQGAQGQQGKMVNGQFVAPGAAAYASQLGSALAGGYKATQLRDAARASDILNGGTGAGQSNLGKFGSWLGGLFGGGA